MVTNPDDAAVAPSGESRTSAEGPWIVSKRVGTVVALAASVVVLAGISAISSLVGPALLAAVIVIAVEPLRAAMARRLPNAIAVGTAVVCAYAIIAVLVAGLVLSASQLIALLPRYTPRFENVVSEVADLLAPLGVTRDDLAELVGGIDPSSVAGALRSVLSSATNVASGFLVLVVLILFLVIDGRHAERLSALPDFPARLAVTLRTWIVRTRRYLVVQTAFGFVVALADVALLWALGIPAPWVWGLLSFVTNYVPNVGFVFGVAPPAIIAVLQDGLGAGLAVVAGYSIVNFAMQSLVQPAVVGDVVRLSPTVTFISFIFWTLVIGPLGGLLAVPLTLFVKAILVDANPSMRWLGAWLGDADPPSA
ncbi:MAG TPA: AI-2E family transporter [Candidatus Limnocylindrales bacterium]|nr:AI-2E family transporter [Candidatus Limnocylindrales bacterium]